MKEKPLCAGMFSLLFDSPRVDDHMVAKQLCKKCPVILECRALLRDVQADSTGGPAGGPQGTWAGKLIGRPVRGQGVAS